MKTYSFAYGSGTVELPLDEKNVIGELHGNAVAPLADIRAALWASLDAPIDSAPLCERARAGDTVALVVSDMTRFWMRQDLVVPHLVDYLTERCGVREEDITIVIANGTRMSDRERWEDLPDRCFPAYPAASCFQMPHCRSLFRRPYPYFPAYRVLRSVRRSCGA